MCLFYLRKEVFQQNTTQKTFSDSFEKDSMCGMFEVLFQHHNLGKVGAQESQQEI